jgi:hypothetical protein
MPFPKSFFLAGLDLSDVPVGPIGLLILVVVTLAAVGTYQWRSGKKFRRMQQPSKKERSGSRKNLTPWD